MPFPSKADNNVPWTGARPRFSIVNTKSTWCYHRMAGGSSLSGEAPRTASVDEATIDPVVKAGKAEYLLLTKGGLFTIQSNAKKPLVIEAVDNPGSATLTLIQRDDPLKSRTFPTTFPCKISAREVIKATGGTSGGYIGVLYRVDGQEIF